MPLKAETQSVDQDVALELGDIQGTVLRHRPEQFHGVYLLYRVDNVADAKAALNQVLPHVTSAADWESPRPFALNIVFTWQGLRALGLSREELRSFPEQFRVGMAARKEILGDLGPSDHSAWAPPLGSGDVHIRRDHIEPDPGCLTGAVGARRSHARCHQHLSD